MKIYFSCSITGGRADEGIYQVLVQEMLRQGHEVPTASLSDSRVVEAEITADAHEVYSRDMNWLAESDAVVAEVSTPSHGVGYEIAAGLYLGKPVLCCYQKDRKVSKIITGNDSKNLVVRAYDSKEEAVQFMSDFLAGLV